MGVVRGDDVKSPSAVARRWRVTLTAGRSTLGFVNGEAQHQIASVNTV